MPVLDAAACRFPPPGLAILNCQTIGGVVRPDADRSTLRFNAETDFCCTCRPPRSESGASVSLVVPSENGGGEGGVRVPSSPPASVQRANNQIPFTSRTLPTSRV